MKKLFVLLGIMFFATLSAHASYSDVLYTINSTMNLIDRTDYTINRVQNKVPKTQSQAKTTTNVKSNTETNVNNTTQTTGTQNYSVDIDSEETPLYQNNEQIKESNYTYEQNKVYSGNAKTLGELPAGTIVMDPTSIWKFRKWDNYSGEVDASHPVFWRKLEDDHYAKGATLLLTDYRIASYPFCHSQKGLRDWSESDVRRFLRTTFYNHLSQGFKNAIVEVNIPYADMSGNPKTIKDNFFLLSIVEWGLSDRKNNGTVIKYEDLPNIYGAKSFKYVDNWKSYNISYVGRTIATRTINRPAAKSAGYDNDVFAVASDGVLRTEWSGTNLAYVRPAVNLKSSTKISGPYAFKYGIEKKDSFTYYVLDVNGSGSTSTATPNTTVKPISTTK